MSYKFYLRYYGTRLFSLINFNNSALIIAAIARIVVDNYTIL